MRTLPKEQLPLLALGRLALKGNPRVSRYRVILRHRSSATGPHMMMGRLCSTSPSQMTPSMTTKLSDFPKVATNSPSSPIAVKMTLGMANALSGCGSRGALKGS